MRPRNETARSILASLLARRSGWKAAELAEQLSVSVPTLHRLLLELGPRVLRSGKGSLARYAAARPLRGSLEPLPVYEIDRTGKVKELASLLLRSPTGTCLSVVGSCWDFGKAAQNDWWDGLPAAVQDMRPQGFLGRQFARFHARHLAVGEDPSVWTDDDVLHVLAHVGVDTPGNLIIGAPALRLWQEQRMQQPAPVPDGELAAYYAERAEAAGRDGRAGSSAAGEFPKFAALRQMEGASTPHVLVKYSGADDSAAVRRWSDLLVAEHLALECATLLPGVRSAASRIVTGAGRTFLEVERFDRHAAFGRSPVVSLATLNGEYLGSASSDWPDLVRALGEQVRFAPEVADIVTYLYWFGRLIGNTDMHTGNLAFTPDTHLHVAPCYDMLPMMYAPLSGGEVVPPRVLEPRMPLPPESRHWLAACDAALTFWSRVAEDTRISTSFREVSRRNHAQVQRARAVVA